MNNLDIQANIKRKELELMNLYSINSIYDINTSLLEKIVNYSADKVFGGSFDLRNNIGTRALGAVAPGLINSILPQTPITVIGNRELLKAFAYRVADETAKNLLPDVNVGNLFDGNKNTSLITKRLNYLITVDNSKRDLGFFLKTLTGVDIKPNQLDNKIKGDFFSDGNQAILYNELTGKGQIAKLNEILKNNIYSKYTVASDITRDVNNINFYVDQRADKSNNKYSYSSTIDNPIKGIESPSNPFVKMINHGLNSEDIKVQGQFGDVVSISKDKTLVWGVIPASNTDSTLSNNIDDFEIKRGLLYYTKQIMSTDQRISKTLQHDFDGTKADGSIVYKGSPFDCRKHTIFNKYDNFSRLIRSAGNGVPGSVIENSVIPNIHPVIGKTDALKDSWKYMFSIENLAYNADDLNALGIPLQERGQNDGRLMWFPPYGISFSEDLTAEYNTERFLGRTEPMYTYVGTERNGTFRFKLIMDYPPDVKGLTADQMAEFFACGTQFDGKPKAASPPTVVPLPPPAQEKINQPPTTISFNFYFQNDSFDVNANITAAYEFGPAVTEVSTGATLSDYQALDFELNEDFLANVNSLISAVRSGFTKGDLISLDIKGYTSALAKNAYNDALSKKRVASVKDYLKARMDAVDSKIFSSIKFSESALGESQANGTGTGNNFEDPRSYKTINSQSAKADRKAVITLTVVENPNAKPINKISGNQDNKIVKNASIQNDDGEIHNLLFTEMPANTNFNKSGFDNIESNYYQAVFHSQTPEDFHRRLTFLQQCMRPGRSIDPVNGGKNPVFGKAPICVLRLGDFFHSKIIIRNIGIDYDEAPFDLNPEGMGVQPMIANISMAITFIGGQSLKTAIDRLQNAISMNYYANSTFLKKGAADKPEYGNGIYRFARQQEHDQEAINGRTDLTNNIFNATDKTTLDKLGGIL